MCIECMFHLLASFHSLYLSLTGLHRLDETGRDILEITLVYTYE